MPYKDPEKRRAYLREWQRAHRDKMREYQARWNAKNPDKILLYSQRWREQHPAKAREVQQRHDRKRAARKAIYDRTRVIQRRIASRAYDKAHPESHRERAHRRRVKLMAGFVEKVDFATVYERDQGRCHICGKRVEKKEATLDHLIPVSRGGSHRTSNVRIAHRSCNSRRSSRGPAQLLLL